MARGRDKTTPRKMKPVFLVFCEGETEENYVDFIRQQYKSPIKIISKTEGGHISQHLIQRRQNELKIYKTDKISTFLMYDLDVAPVVEKLKTCNAVWLCSNPCIELWFLLHSKTQAACLTTDNCIRALRKAHQDWSAYQKPSLSDAQKRILWENRSAATERAKTLKENANPSSSVFKLLEAVEKHSKSPQSHARH